MDKRRNVGFPVHFLSILKGTEHVQERQVEPFRHSIALRVLLDGTAFRHLRQRAQLLDNCPIEVAALVAVKPRRKTIVDDAVLK